MRASVLSAILVIAFFLCQNCSAQHTAFDPHPWVEDFHQLLDEMSSHYSNLEWAVEERRMDLPSLKQQTEEKLSHAADETQARAALEKFLDAFGDGHLEVHWSKPDSAPDNTSTSIAHPSICDQMDFKKPARLSPGIAFELLPGFTGVTTGTGDDEFATGLLELSAGKRVGIIRLPVFSDRAHPGVCTKALRELDLKESQACDAKCQDNVERVARNILTDAVASRAEDLAKRGAAALLIDITHNGGGSDWVEVTTRVLTSVPLRDPRLAFLKHEHWTKDLSQRLKVIESDLKTKSGSQPSLASAKDILSKAIAETRRPCDRSQVWATGKLPCSQLVKNVLYTSGVLPYAKPGSFSGLRSKTILFHPLLYDYVEGRNRLPLFVAVDRGTWSAAEYFAAVLQDNGAATILGELTGGAGCGHTNGGIGTTLKNTHADVSMPDCVRLRKDGSDEVNGITPDVLVPWASRDTPYTKASKFLPRLRSALDHSRRAQQ